MSLALSRPEELRDYSIEVRVRNARILGLMRRAGIETAAELSRKCGISQQAVGKLINLKVIPIHRISGKYLQQVERIAEALGCHPDDMFTDLQRTRFMATNRRCIEVAEAEVEAHLAALEVMAPDEHVALLERDDALQEALGKLTPQERLVIEARFGFNGPEQTLDQVGETIDLHKERVRQIEAKALRKLTGLLSKFHNVEETPKKFDKQEFINHQAFLIEQRKHKKNLEREWKERNNGRNDAVLRGIERQREIEKRHDAAIRDVERLSADIRKAEEAQARYNEWLRAAFERRRAAARENMM